jgi:hypothetical protein
MSSLIEQIIQCMNLYSRQLIDGIGQRNSILVDIGRQINVLEERVAQLEHDHQRLHRKQKKSGTTHQPLLRTIITVRISGDTTDAITLRLARIHRIFGQILGLDRKRPPTKGHRDGRIRRTRQGEPSLSIRLGSLYDSMHGLGVTRRSQDTSGARIEDGGTVGQCEVHAVDGDSVHGAFPEAFVGDVRDGDESGRVEFARVKSAKGDLAVRAAVGEAGDFVGGDSFFDESLLGEGFNGGGNALVRQ